MLKSLELKNLTKRFGEVVANDNISFTLNKGEILALLGENGSGKTTLMNMISGIYYPDSGDIYLDDNKINITSPKDAFRYNIGMVHQHFKLIDNFTASQNIILGLRGTTFINRKEIDDQVKMLCDKYGFEVDLKKKIYDMSISEKQTVEILKLLYRGTDILILDEPTAVLTPQEITKLFFVLKKMKEDGKSIIIITHKLNEVMEISDRVSVLRKGQLVGSVVTKEVNETILTDMMVGKHITLQIDRSEPKGTEDCLIVKNLSVKNEYGYYSLKDVSFSAKTHEILGIAGVAGSGQKELLEAIAGLQKCEQGSSITYFHDNKKEELVGMTPKKIKELDVALAFVPEDRLGMGLVGSMGMVDNMLLRSYEKGNNIFVERKKPTKLANKLKDTLEIVTPSINAPVRKLSGGNVQKVLVGREIASNPKLLMTAYAVRGLDINTSYAIYNILNEQKEKGAGVIYVGEDLDVLLSLCDRIAVLCNGRLTGVVDARTTSKQEIGVLMGGLSN
jgi:simple sugar transport system ATP-binding protein